MKKRLGALTAAMVDKALPLVDDMNEHVEAHRIQAAKIWYERPLATTKERKTIGGTD